MSKWRLCFRKSKKLKNLLTVKEAAEFLKVHPHHLYRLKCNKAIPYLQIPGVGVRFDQDELIKWIQEGKVDVTDWTSKAQNLIR